jgi:hypothetical protein
MTASLPEKLGMKCPMWIADSRFEPQLPLQLHRLIRVHTLAQLLQSTTPTRLIIRTDA